MSETRKSELYDRYTEVLMRDKVASARPIQPEIEIASEHGSNSICETKNSNDNHQEAEQGETTMPLVDIDRMNEAVASPKQNGE